MLRGTWSINLRKNVLDIIVLARAERALPGAHPHCSKPCCVVMRACTEYKVLLSHISSKAQRISRVLAGADVYG